MNALKCSSAIGQLCGCLFAALTLSSTLSPSIAFAETKSAIVYPEAIGPWLATLFIAKDQGLFAKRGIEMSFVEASGASVPRIGNDIPFGFVGGPAFLIQASGGTDLKFLGAFSRVKLAGAFVANASIKSADELRGKRVGVRVVGAGIWINTILALKQFGLDPKSDGILTVPVGSPAQIVKALEDGTIDAALVSEDDSSKLKSKGFVVLKDAYPPGTWVYENGLIATSTYVQNEPGLVGGVVESLIEAVSFAHDAKNRKQTEAAIASALKLPATASTDTAYRELMDVPEKPYPTAQTLKTMQAIMAINNPAFGKLNIDELVDDRFVRKADESGTIDTFRR